jgi:hypothetical protein
MRKSISPKFTILMLITIVIILHFTLLKSIYASLIILVFAIGVVYLNGLYRYSYFKNRKQNVALASRRILKFLPIYDVKFDSVEVERIDFLIVFSVVPVILLLMIQPIISTNELLLTKGLINIAIFNSVIYAFYISGIIFVLTLSEDIVKFIKVLCNNKSLFLILEGFSIGKFKDINDYIQHHKHIYLMELDYQSYTLKDLKREKFYLEGKLERARKPAFYDSYVLPLIIIFITGVISLGNMYINNFIISEGDYTVLEVAFSSYAVIASSLLMFVLLISFMIRKVSYNSIQDLKSRILVIDDIIEEIK